MESPLNISQFKRSSDKSSGITRGYFAKYNDQEYLIKSFKNGNLTQKEKQERLEEFEKSFKESGKKIQQFLPTKLRQEEFQIDALFDQAVQSVCYDDLNLADCIREYISAPIYKILLGNLAPDVKLVINDKDKDQIYLASKIIPHFKTATEGLKDETQKFKDAKGLEKIIAAQLLMGEGDMMQTGNFGVKDNSGDINFAKIDHGRSTYLHNVALLNLIINFSSLKACGFKVYAKDLRRELKLQSKTLSAKKQEVKQCVKEKVANLEQNLSKEAVFTLRTTEGYIIPTFAEKEFKWNEEVCKFTTKSGQTLEDFFIKEIDQYKERANCVDKYRDRAIISGAMLCLPTGAIIAIKFKKEIIKDRDYKIVLGVSIALCCVFSLALICYTFGDIAAKGALEPGQKLNNPSFEPQWNNETLAV